MITKNPWNNECEMCYSKHKFKTGDWMFQILHPWSPDEPIIVCKVCLILSGVSAQDKKIFPFHGN